MNPKPLLFAGAFALVSLSLQAKDVTLGATGRVSVEFISSDAAFQNTATLITATRPDGKKIRIASSGCTPGSATNQSGTSLFNEKASRPGCRVTLDGDDSTPNQVEGFEVGTTLEFGLCVQPDPNRPCQEMWSTNPNSNRDHAEHTLALDLYPGDFPGRVFRIGWDDTENGDRDFNDVIMVVRVELDSDGDGLWDDWEKFGVDTNGDGIIDLDLPAAGANPMHKDVFLEIDYMGCNNTAPNCAGGHDHRPKPDGIQTVINAFAAAPVTNPDGTNGITLHVDVSNAVSHQDVITFGDGFAAIKNDPANFGVDNPRRFAYRYAIFGHQYNSATNFSSGVAEMPGDDLMVTLTGASAGAEAGTLMHELGHTLGLNHGGGDGTNNKPNYPSIMSYRYQFDGVPYQMEETVRGCSSCVVLTTSVNVRKRYDYSRIQLPELDETNLDEAAEIYGAANRRRVVRSSTDFLGLLSFETVERPMVTYNCSATDVREGAVTDGTDWNCNGFRFDRLAQGDLNDGPETKLTGYNDWANLVYSFHKDALRYGAVHPEPDLKEQSVTEAMVEHEKTNQIPIAVITPFTGPVLAREIDLDGSRSIDPDEGALTYSWKVLSRPAALNHAESPKATVQFGGGPGEYVFELTVTDAKGASSSTTTTINYVGR